MEELRQDVVRQKGEVARLRAEGRVSNLYILERWIEDAEKILARWDGGGPEL